MLLAGTAAAVVVWLPLELVGRPATLLDFTLAAVIGAVFVTNLPVSSPTLPTKNGGAAVARRKSSEYRREATAEPFELELDGRNEDGSPVVIVFGDPNDMENETAFDLAIEENPRESLRKMLLRKTVEGREDDWQWRAFWAEWRTRKVGELNDLLADVMSHYGADRGKLARSSR